MNQVLSFQSAVAKRYVHRHAIAEVYLTDCVPVGDDRFLVGAQWPRLHAFYRTCTGRYDTMLLAETVRQCAIYLAHVRYAVPMNYKFTMQRMQVDCSLDLLTIGSRAAEVTIDARVTGTARRHGILSAFTVTLEFHVDGVAVGHGSAVANVLAPSAYERARWQGAGARAVGIPPGLTPVDSDAVCVPDPRAVVLGPHPAGAQRGMWLLRSDLTHPVLFDHPLDHVPGALILEAARQAARLRLGQSCADVEHLDVGFRRFLELDEATTVAARISDAEEGCVEVEFSQWGEVHAVGSVRLSVPAKARDHAMAGTQRA
ncbi:ScbA/BarX family gamma-butyrolactone biosynthesis protein [Rhodococcus sp. ACT016]|uniref:ScbA/BarX family gamma-butyrolactone biosynthesis protein n=1 Tax=Rhodococcus sp. ACT016 TaxID=3134808 RepID=UPI003D2CF2B1